MRAALLRLIVQPLQTLRTGALSMRSIFSILAGLTLVGPAAFAQQPRGRLQALPNIRVSFDQPAMRAPVLLAKLGAQIGVSFDCGPELTNDVLLLHVHDRPLLEIMLKLAQADSAEWLARDGKFELTRSPQYAATLAAAEASRRR